jgi:hypothetical protein
MYVVDEVSRNIVFESHLIYLSRYDVFDLLW